MTKEELRKQILTLQKQQQESDSLKEREDMNVRIEMLTETLEALLVNSPIKVKISYEVLLSCCELPNYDLLIYDFIESGDLNSAIIENAKEIEIDSDDLKIEIQ